jgi:CRISPR system Cascade subunit CasE
MSDTVHLVKVPLRAEKLVAIARQRGLPLRNLDDGYLCHCMLRELWQDLAPSPFVLRSHRRTLDLWGYSTADAATLVDRAQAFGDPSWLSALVDADPVVSKPMPRFKPGRRVGFLLRACPVVRVGSGTAVYRPGAEVDAFLARCAGKSRDVRVDREAVYREWLLARLNQSEKTGASAEAVRIASFARERLVRRTQGTDRRAHGLERPDVRFEGDVVIMDGERFNKWLAHGVGRHRAFGFGALILVPPGTQHAA